MDEPKIYYVNDDAEGDGTFTVSRRPWYGYIKVIEFSAYENLLNMFNKERKESLSCLEELRKLKVKIK